MIEAMGLDGYEERAALHAALADPLRLAIVDELTWSDRSPSSLTETLEIDSNLLAHHLGVLEEAGVVDRLRSAGDGRRRYVRLRPEATSSIVAPFGALASEGVLFVCTANSARSQLGAAIWNARSEVPATSAGTHPAPRVRPQAVAAARRAGLHLRDVSTRSVDEVRERPDLLITVCDVAHEELAALPTGATVLHWSIPDPALEGTPAAFDRTVRALGDRIDTLAPHVRPRRRPRRTHP